MLCIPLNHPFFLVIDGFKPGSLIFLSDSLEIIQKIIIIIIDGQAKTEIHLFNNYKARLKNDEKIMLNNNAKKTNKKCRDVCLQSQACNSLVCKPSELMLNTAARRKWKQP